MVPSAPVLRFDRAQVGKVSVTPEGFVRALETPIARTGVQTYLRQDGTKQVELRLPEEVFAEESLATLDGKLVTRGHPKVQRVDAKNARELSRGVVSAPKALDDLLVVNLTVHDADTIKAIRDGEDELSCGYFTTLEPVPGGVFRQDGHPMDGTPADFIQRKIEHNHVAILRAGRANQGRADRPVRIRLDGEIETMPTIEIQGQSYEVPEAVHAHVTKMRSDADALKVSLQDAKSKRDEAEGKIAVLSQELAAKKADSESEEAEAKRREAEASRIETVLAAAKVLGKKPEELTRLDSDQLEREMAQKLIPGIKLDGKSADYVRGIISVAKTQRQDAGTQILGGLRSGSGQANPSTRQEAAQRYRDIQMGVAQS